MSVSLSHMFGEILSPTGTHLMDPARGPRLIPMFRALLQHLLGLPSTPDFKILELTCDHNGHLMALCESPTRSSECLGGLYRAIWYLRFWGVTCGADEDTITEVINKLPKLG